MQDHNKNSYTLTLVCICIEVDSIVLKTVKEAQKLLTKTNISFETIITFSEGNHPDLTDILFKKIEKKSPAFSRNQAFKYSSGKNITFLDNDTLVNSFWVEKAINFCKSEVLDAIFFQEENEKSRMFPLEFNTPPPLYFADTAGCIIKKEVFSKGASFNEDLPRGEDVELATTLVRNHFLVEFTENGFIDLQKDSLNQKIEKREANAAPLDHLLNTFVKSDKVEQEICQAKQIKSYLNLLERNGKLEPLVDDFFILNEIFYFYNHKKMNSSKNFKVVFQKKNVKHFKVEEDIA